MQVQNLFENMGRFICRLSKKEEARAKINAKYETEEKISNKEFFKRKWILTPYLS